MIISTGAMRVGKHLKMVKELSGDAQFVILTSVIFVREKNRKLTQQDTLIRLIIEEILLTFTNIIQ